MFSKCKKHNRTFCVLGCQRDERDNLGSPSIDTTGGLSVGIGNGMTIDPSDGSLGMQIAPGISLDFDGN
jgi:hypothetical protein